MCRSNAHGGRRCPSINSDRTRAFNTARRRLSRANKALNDYHEANPDINIFDDDEYMRLDEKLENAENALTQLRLEDYQRERARQEAELADLRSQLGITPLPERLVKTGDEFQKAFPPLITRLAGEFDESKFNHPLNRETAAELGKDGPFGKPHGGLWVAPLAPNGRSEWENFIDDEDYSPPNNTTSRYEMRISPDAKVLVIDSWEDYVAAVDSAPRKVPDDYSRYLGKEPNDRKGLDYQKLGVDLVFVTNEGVRQCSFADRGSNARPNGQEYESLYGWDFASGVVMNPKSVNFVQSS